MSEKPLVAIVGRVNVGKSSLFNLLTKKRTAITFSEPATTRDRIYGDVVWKKRIFSLIDTGGLFAPVDDDIQTQVYEQTALAVKSADIILFIVDASSGISPIDSTIADMLRQEKKPVVLAANKIDKKGASEEVGSFFKMGFGGALSISATHSRGIKALLNKLTELLSCSFPVYEAKGKVSSRIAIVGRPNVGKSSYINALLQENRVIVNKNPGTTRDAIDITFRHRDVQVTLVDTSGLKSRTKTKGKIEVYSDARGYKNIRDCDIAVVIVDTTLLLTKQDNAIINHIREQGKCCIIAVNKWDLAADLNNKKEEAKLTRDCADALRERAPITRHIPIIFISALTGHRVGACIELARDTLLKSTSPIPTGILNRVLEKIGEFPGTCRELKIYYATQLDTKPPTFILFVNKPQKARSCKGYLENRFRKILGFEGAPLRFVFKGKK